MYSLLTIFLESYQDYLVKIYTDEIESKRAPKDESLEVIHGNIMMIKILLTYSKTDVKH